MPFSTSPFLDRSAPELEFVNIGAEWDSLGFDWTSGMSPSTNDTSSALVSSVSSKSTRASSVADFGIPAPRRLVDPCQVWYAGFTRCTKLRFLVDMFRAMDSGLHSPPNSIPLQPEQKSIEPLLQTFLASDRILKQQQGCQIPQQSGGEVMRTTAGGLGVRHLLPARSMCDKLLDAYLNSFESVLRILHMPTFVKEYGRFWSENTNDQAFEYKLLISLAIGTCACSDLDASLREQAPGWIARANTWLVESAAQGVQPDFNTAQITCLLSLARQTLFNMDTDSPVVDSMSLPGACNLMRLAIRLHLHREPRVRSPSMPVKEAELRRRLWATMLELTLQQCLHQKLTPPIGPQDYDCESPSSVSDDDIELNTPPSDCALKFTASTPIMVLARTQRLRLHILHRLVKSEMDYDEIHQYSSELNDACRVHSKMLRSALLSSVPRSSKPSHIQLMLLGTLLRPFILALHGPFAEQATARNMNYYYSRRACLETSALLLSDTPVLPPDDGGIVDMIRSTTTTDGEIHTSKETPDLYAAIRIHAKGQFALAQRQAAAALSVNLLRELEDNPFPTLDGGSRQQLHTILRNAVDIFEKRVRLSGGVDSARDFVFVSCAEAYIASLLVQLRSSLSHDNSDLAIARAARTSLAVCCGVMMEGSIGAGVGCGGSGAAGCGGQVPGHEVDGGGDGLGSLWAI